MLGQNFQSLSFLPFSCSIALSRYSDKKREEIGYMWNKNTLALELQYNINMLQKTLNDEKKKNNSCFFERIVMPSNIFVKH